MVNVWHVVACQCNWLSGWEFPISSSSLDRWWWPVGCMPVSWVAYEEFLGCVLVAPALHKNDTVIRDLIEGPPSWLIIIEQVDYNCYRSNPKRRDQPWCSPQPHHRVDCSAAAENEAALHSYQQHIHPSWLASLLACQL